MEAGKNDDQAEIDGLRLSSSCGHYQPVLGTDLMGLLAPPCDVNIVTSDDGEKMIGFDLICFDGSSPNTTITSE